jgi:hypothetical protein
MVSYHNIYTFTWKSAGKTHNQTDHFLRDGRQHSNVLDVRFFSGVDYDTAVRKQTTYKFYIERSNLKKLNEVEGKEQY